MTRWGIAAVLTAALGLTGCGCGQSTVECTDVTVKFESPQAGDTVVSPFDVEIRAADSNGVAFKFDSATLTSGTFSASGAVSDATAHFNGVQLAGGPHRLTATIVKDTCTRTATLDITVMTETCTNPSVTGVSFPQDVSNDGILNAAEVPMGTSMTVRVAAECTTGVQVQIKRGGTVVGGPMDFSNGAAVVTLPTLPDADSATYDLTAELLQGGTPVGQPGSGSIRVERGLPACENTTVEAQGPMQGGAGATHPLLATGTTSGVSAEFRLDGSQSMSSTPTTGMVSASWQVAKAGERTYAVELRCTDTFGNVASDIRNVRVDYLAPTVTITEPATKADGGFTIVTESPVTVRVTTNAEDGSLACAFRVQGATRTAAGCVPVVGGLAAGFVDLPLDGVYTLEVEVTDLAGNVATGSVAIEVRLSGCGLGFTRPGACPALITAASAQGGIYAFQTQSNVTCTGQTVRFEVQTTLADGGVGTATPVGTGTIDGAGQASISGAVTSGTYVYTAAVDNLADAGVSVAHCDVTVDLDGPVIQFPAVPSGELVSTVNAFQDTQAASCGAQRLLQFSARVPTGGRVDLCTTQAIDPCTMLTRSTSATCGSGWYLMQANVSSPSSGFTFTEGQYSIKIVVVGGGTTNESAEVPLLVDVTRPCVRKVANPWPQDTTAPQGALNATELMANAPRLQFELDPGCKDTDTSTLSPTSPVVVRNVVAGVPTGSFNLAADATFTGGTYSVNLTQGVANEQDYAFFVELTDAAGNRNLYTGAMDPAQHDVRVDRVAPTCDVVDPSSSQTLLGQSQVPGGQLSVTVASSADVSTNGVSVSLTGPTTTMRTLTPAAPAFQASTTFAVTGTNGWTVSSTCTDVAGNATPASSRTLTVDLDAPTCTIVAPSNAMPYTVNQIQTTVSATGAEGRMVNCTSNGTPLTPALLVAGGTATHLLTYPNGTQTVACSLTDPAGNAGSCTMLGVVVNSTACGLNLTSTVTNPQGFWHNRSNTGSLTANSGVATVTATTPDCGAGKTVTLQRMVPTMGTATTAATGAGGTVSFASVALVDGERWEVRIDNGTGVITTQSFRVALVAPAAVGVTIAGAAVASGSNIAFGAATGNRNVETAVAGYFADTNAGTAGAQFDTAINTVTRARKFGLDGTVQLLFKGMVVDSQVVTTEPQSFSFIGSTLPHNDSGAFEVRVLDAAGNSSAILNNPTVIDVVAPGAPAVTQSVSSARGAQVTLQWAPTGDDGAAGTGGHAGYDVRWTTSSVPSHNDMATSADYFGTASYKDTESAWSASTITRLLDVPPLNTYYVAVRARDEVGNYSAFSAPTGLDNPWTRITLSAPVTGSLYGQSVLATTSLNNDAIEDLVVSAPTQPGGGAVYVYYGASGLASQATCGAGCQQILPSDATAGQFGSDFGAGGNLGDVAAEGKPDLVIGQLHTASPFAGRVVIFFGNGAAATLSTATSIELRGDAATRIGYTARLIRDLDGDGLDELAIPAPLFNSNQGRIFVYRGRSQAQWAALRTATDPSTMVPYVPVSAATADYVIDGPIPLLGASGNAFGQNRWGLVSVGDINSDTVSDIALPTSRATINRYRIFSGAAVAASSGAMPLSANTYLLELSETAGANSAANSGLGSSSVGGRDLVDSSAVDLVTSYNGGGRVHVYSGLIAMGVGQPSPIATITGPNSFGFLVGAGQLNTGDSRADLLVGEGLTVDNLAWIIYQKLGGAFDGTGTQVIGTSPAFWVSKFDGAAISGSSTTSLGRSNAVADVDGNGLLDVVLSDDRAGTVQIWR